ncbi:GNAT family N-acetyltransferase [Aeromicrobium wangtongii]|uniref:GNAT family N-acetyltransferase n=1 Tax=Aeromicrobium wangtongii TaxID=2969247 RepID=A0ABY5M4F2_9ACTN|nr:GNAT family N-acetyltransferase [Aeromicrobium wangtongii]MCD9198903.1 GNAT family N-acetyltransferase [Aeromicrobium wangtongii]UUP13058.1 GNAT family N-acetyltransferase [Aeromicrobium wangtongii]
MRWPLTVPVLSDGVVTLRAHAPQDVDPMVEMAVDPQMVRWTAIPTPYTRDMSEQFAFAAMPRGWETGSHRGWAIEATDDDGRSRFAGNIDIRNKPIADIGFALHPWARGRGIMARAVRLAVDWSLTEGGVEIVHWRSHVGNEGSLRVAHATGFTLHGLVPGMLLERGAVLDAWTASIRFGDAPFARTAWAESAVLESDRLRLRPFTGADVPRIVEACSDPLSRHFLAALPHPYTAATARAYLDDCVWQAATGAKATWAIADRTTDELLGNISVMDMLGVSAEHGEIGYWLHPDARGRGVMTEAVRTVIRHAFSPDGLDRRRLVLYAAVDNPASNAVAVAAGFDLYGTQRVAERLGDGSYDDLNGYELIR